MRIAGLILALVGLAAVLWEVLGYGSWLIYFGTPIGGILGIIFALLGAFLMALPAALRELRQEKRTNPMEWYVTIVDSFSDTLGAGVGWFTTLMVAVVFINVVIRYIFGGGEIVPSEAPGFFSMIVQYVILGLRNGSTALLSAVNLPVPSGASLALQDGSWYVFGVVFLIGAAYTLKHDRHVRVDIFYINYPPRVKVWVNLLGSLFFLVPLCLLGIWVSWDFVGRSLQLQETSPDAGGLAARYLAKAMMPAGFILIIIQGISLTFRSILQLMGRLPIEEEKQEGVIL